MKATLILILLSLLVSCEPDSNDSVKTGSSSNNLLIIKPNPILTIPPYQSDATDSLDLNSDNKFDIKFVKKVTPLLTGFGSVTAISTSNTLQIVLSKTNNFPDSLNVNISLDNNSNWSKPESAIYELQSYKCNTSNCESIGNFINVNDKYIGYKLGSKFGWIKIDNSADGELLVKEYTVIK